MITDAGFGVPWDKQLKHHQTINEDVYGFVFNYRSDNNSRPEWLGKRISPTVLFLLILQFFNLQSNLQFLHGHI